MATQWELIDASVAKRQVPLEKTYLGPIVQWDWQPPCDPMDYKRLDDYAFGVTTIVRPAYLVRPTTGQICQRQCSCGR